MVGQQRQAGRDRKAERQIQRKRERRALPYGERLARRIVTQQVARQKARRDRDRARDRKIAKARRQLHLDRPTAWDYARHIKDPDQRLQGLFQHFRALVNPRDQPKADRLLRALQGDAAAKIQVRHALHCSAGAERVTYADLLVTYRPGQQVAVLGILDDRHPREIEAAARLLARKGIGVLVVPHGITEGLAALVTETRRSGIPVVEHDRMGRTTHRNLEPPRRIEHRSGGSGNHRPGNGAPRRKIRRTTAQVGRADERCPRLVETETPGVWSYAGTSRSPATTAQRSRGSVGNPHPTCSGSRPGPGGTGERRGLRRRPALHWAVVSQAVLVEKNPDAPEFLSNAWWKAQRTRIPFPVSMDVGRNLHIRLSKRVDQILRLMSPEAAKNRKRLLRRSMKMRIQGQVREANRLARRAARTAQRAFSSPTKRQEVVEIIWRLAGR